MKLIEKSECTYVDGYIVDKKGHVMCVSEELVHDSAVFNRLLEFIDWMGIENVGCSHAKSMDNFDPNSKYVCEELMPTLNERIETANKVMDELDQLDRFKKAKELFNVFPSMNAFVKSDYLIRAADGCDVKMLKGNILNIDADDVLHACVFWLDHGYDANDLRKYIEEYGLE